VLARKETSGLMDGQTFPNPVTEGLPTTRQLVNPIRVLSAIEIFVNSPECFVTFRVANSG